MLARVDARKLREDAGISRATVARAFGVHRRYIAWWETGQAGPVSQAGYRWARVIAALERRAAFAAEMERTA